LTLIVFVRIVMLGCLGREVTAAAVSVVDYVASVVDYEARPMEDAEEVMDVVGMLLAVATSRTRICIRITRVRISRREDTAVERMMEDLLEGTVVVMARRVTSQQSPVNKSWFAT
jgi:hypothetical protein